MSKRVKKIKDIKISDPAPELCNHDPNSIKTSLIFLPMTTFEFPQVYRAVCPNCGKSFEFIKMPDGTLVEDTNE